MMWVVITFFIRRFRALVRAVVLLFRGRVEGITVEPGVAGRWRDVMVSHAERV
jgi:hypothetical protein